MLRGISSDYMPRLVMETVGEMVHIFLVGTFTVETAAFTEFGYKVCRAGGGNYTAILPKCKLSSYYANFLVLNLKKTFWSAVKKGIFESGLPIHHAMFCKGNHVGGKPYPIFHLCEIGGTRMLAEIQTVRWRA